MQVLGGYGVSPEYHLARLLADAVEIFPATGTPQIMKIIQAMEIVSDATPFLSTPTEKAPQFFEGPSFVLRMSLVPHPSSLFPGFL